MLAWTTVLEKNLQVVLGLILAIALGVVNHGSCYAQDQEAIAQKAAMVQVHWSWYFLPWHRGYIYFLERILDNLLKTNFGWNGEAFAYPYWDWSNHQEMPNTKSRKQAGLSSPLFGYDLTQ